MSKVFLLCCAAALGVQAQTVAVTAAPVNASFTYQIGAALPAAQTVSVKTNAGTPAFTTAITGMNTLWLTVSPDSGKMPGSLSLRANPTSLAVGTYNATVTVTATGVTNPLNIPVTLAVSSPPSTVTLSAATLNFAAPPIPTAAQTVTLSTNGTPISFSAASGAAWLTVSPTVGVVLPGEREVLTISVDASSLVPQTAPYVGKITVTAAGAGAKAQSVTVSLTVNSTKPTIASVWPGTLPINGGAQTITIRGTNFYAATVAKVQGAAAPLTTTVLSPTALLAVVPASLSTVAATLNVLVSNPAPGGDSVTSPVTVANVASIQAVVNAASYVSGSVSPGELATIFGVNIGPSTPASLTITNGYVDTTLGGVTVTVDGKAAPLIYVSQNQISIQVPYEATAGIGKAVVVTNAANPPANGVVTIAAAAPGIFTADGSGAGQAAALNFNATTMLYSLNSSTNTARIGDTVILYLTGEGNYNAAPLAGATNTGYVIPPMLSPLPQVSPLPVVTIGGAAAVVAYAGPIPGSILGLLQINVTVPAGSTTGAAAPVVVTIGGIATQASVTLAIHP
ncbi:MAG TPA: IPT/TIG domain-containing protein [Bryobacteraceae bacterium]